MSLLEILFARPSTDFNKHSVWFWLTYVFLSKQISITHPWPTGYPVVPRKTSDVPRSSKPVTIRRYFTTKRFLKKNWEKVRFMHFSSVDEFLQKYDEVCCLLFSWWCLRSKGEYTSHEKPSNPSEHEDFPGHLLSPDPPDAAKVATWFRWSGSLVDVDHTKCVIFISMYHVLLWYVYRRILISNNVTGYSKSQYHNMSYS